MLLSIIINTYERPEALARCVEAVALQPDAMPYELIAVDDGGGSDLEALARRWRGRLDFQLLRVAHQGRAAARNRGVEAARGERLLFLGDDVLAAPGCLARHRACADPLLALVGPYPLRALAGSPPFRRWVEPNPQHKIKDPQNAGFWFFATGNLSLCRATFLELGGFDPRFEVYGWEDIDLGLRFERAGGRLIFDPQARAEHDHPLPSRAQLWRREYEMGITAWQFYEKWAAEAPDVAGEMAFWSDPAAIRPAPRWRRRLGEGLVGLLDRLAPASRLNERLFERMVFSQRLAGVAEGWRRGVREARR